MGRPTRGVVLGGILALLVVQAGEAQDPGTALAAYTGMADSADTKMFCPMVRKNFSNFSSAFSIQNSSSSASNVTVEYYSDESTPVHTENITIPARSPSYFNSADISELGSSFQGSVVVTSNQPTAIGVIDYDGTTAAAYGCGPAGPSIVNLPANFCGAFGFNTRWAIQNAGTSTASVVISLSGGATQGLTVAPNLSRFLTLDTIPGINCNFNSFQSAQISSDQPVVVTVENFWNGGESRGQYRGLSADGNMVVQPLVANQYAGYTTGLVIQNVGSSTDTFQITYENNPGSTENVPLNAGEVGFGSSVLNLPTGYIGRAGITGNQPANVINELASGGGTPIDSAYAGGAGLSGQGQAVFLPAVYKSWTPFGSGQQWTASLQVVNQGPSQSSITVTLYNQSGNSFPISPAPLPRLGQPTGRNLEVGESVLIDLATLAGSQLPDGIYSAVVESDGADLAAAALITIAEAAEIFLDGLESGDTSAWSNSTP